MSYDMGCLKLAGKTIGEGTFGKAAWQNSSLGEFRVPISSFYIQVIHDVLSL